MIRPRKNVPLVVRMTAHDAGSGDECARRCGWGRLRTMLVVGMSAHDAGGGEDCKRSWWWL
jgi:hypothetical protein